MGPRSSKNNYASTSKVEAKKEVSTPIHQGAILGIDSSSSIHGGKLVCGSDDKTVSVLDWQDAVKKYNPDLTKVLTGHTKAVNRVCIRENVLFSISRDLSLRVWDTNDGKEKSCFSNSHGLNIAAMSATMDGTKVATGSRDYSVKIRNIVTGDVEREFSSPRNIVTCMSYDQAEIRLYQGSEDLCVRVWDTRESSKVPAQQLLDYVYFPLCISLHEGGHLLSTGCKGFNTTGGGEVKVWDLRMNKIIFEYKMHIHDVTSTKFDGKYIVSVSKDGSISRFDSNDPNCQCFLQAPSSALLTGLTILEQSKLDSNRAAVSSFDGSLSFFEFSKENIKYTNSTPYYFRSEEFSSNE